MRTEAREHVSQRVRIDAASSPTRLRNFAGHDLGLSAGDGVRSRVHLAVWLLGMVLWAVIIYELYFRAGK